MSNEAITSYCLAMFLRLLALVPVALLVWWLHRYVPFIPHMGFGSSVALVAIVYVLRRWV